MKITNLFALLMILLFASACNMTKYVPEGEYLLSKVNISSDNKEVGKDEIKSYIRQVPNTSVLGMFKLQLGMYNLSGRDSSKWVNRFLKKIGDEPVILDEQITELTQNQIAQLMYNRGFYNAKVSYKVTNPKEKRAIVTYNITSNKPYRIRNYSVNINQPELYEIASDSARSSVKTGKLFDSDMLDEERKRITTQFRNVGYFNFTKDDLHFLADSALNSNEIDLVLEVKSGTEGSEPLSTNKLFRKYKINRVNFFSESDKTIDNIGVESVYDTLTLDNYTLVYENTHNIRPTILIQSSHLLPGNPYSDRALERTYSSINTLSAVKYMDISFREISDSLLDAHIILTPNKLQTLSTDVEGTYSTGYWGFSGYWGLGSNINYSHRNIFHGSESLSIRGRAIYEYQGRSQHAYELGVDAGLKFPTFLFPFATRDFKRNVRAATEINGSYSFRQRPKEYTGIITGVGFKYSWIENLQVKHNVDALNISYVYYPYISSEYQEYLSTSPYFVYNFQNRLIMRTGYSGSFSEFTPQQPLKSYSNYSYSIETAGNLLYGLNNLFNSSKDSLGSYKIFGIRYAQYVKADLSISHRQIFDENNRIVYHAALGIAVPYGNNNQIPFEKRYFSGGANSVRGWTAYQLGPGTYRDQEQYVNYNTQMGDIRIDLNMEYRTKLFWKLEGALFLDAGNIWTIRDYDTQPGGVFRFSDFVGQMGVAYGTGIRADFSFFVIRLDLGIKLHDPALSRTQRWRTNLTKNDYALNLAIGYPF